MRVASILLFVAAALQPVVLFAYYGIEYAVNADAAVTDFSDAGALDVAVFGVIAVLCGILGILVARGSRVAAWCVWVFGLLGVPIAAVGTLGVLVSLVVPSEDQEPAGLLAIVAAYLVVVSLAIAASAILLVNSKARGFFFKRRNALPADRKAA